MPLLTDNIYFLSFNFILTQDYVSPHPVFNSNTEIIILKQLYNCINKIILITIFNSLNLSELNVYKFVTPGSNNKITL